MASHLKTIHHIGIDNLPQLAEELIAGAGNRKLWAFYGEMGAGKTTLIKAICAHLKIIGEVSSPTFSLVNEYHTASEETVYHFDFYRIKTIDEVYDMGYEDYFYSGAICLMEWPEKIEELLEGEDVFSIKLVKENETMRSILLD